LTFKHFTRVSYNFTSFSSLHHQTSSGPLIPCNPKPLHLRT
jgi:ribose 5-phosphate isomerase A